MEYTLAQVRMFSAAIDRLSQDESRLQLTLLRIAQASKKDYEAACRKLFGIGG
jgi:hypothetical protein